ncbi:MAG: hypothetical protein ISS71_03750 [Phycisphaerae bacterium]|nr:hypothetical protein [Phycisphaerae bacterium]
MKTFWQTIYRTMWKSTLWLTAMAIVILSIVNGIAYCFGDPPLVKINTWYIGAIVAIYSMTRIFRFHPAFNKKYLIQLTLSPWKVGKALPRGPVNLFWADAIIVTFFMVLTFIFPVHHWPILLIIFLAAYNLGLLASFCITRQIEFISTYVLLAPLIVYPHLNFYIALMVLISLTSIGLWGVHCYFKQFPWNTPWWNKNQVDELKQQAITQRVIQWPFRELNITNIFSAGVETGVILAILFFMYAHTINWLVYNMENERITAFIYAIPIIFLPIFRFTSYAIKYRPPISFLGRFRTGRLIIPGYDKVYIGPIVILLAGIFMPFLLKILAIPNHITYELSASICIFLAFACPPNFEKWHYTGHHRILKPLSPPTRTVKRKNPAVFHRL